MPAAENPAAPRLEANLRLDRGDFRLEASLDARLSGVTAVFGPSGCGKTTLLRAIAGLEREARGRIAFDGTVWQDDRTFIPTRERRAGLVFQDARLFSHLTVRGNILYGHRRTPADERIFQPETVIRLMALEPLLGRRVSSLSGGERQRVSFARAVLATPRLLLMDEPLASLDQDRKEEILPFIERLAGELAIPTLYVSHEIDEVVRLASDLVLVSDGRVVASGPIEEVSNRFDLRSYAGRLDAGSIIRMRVAGHDEETGITRFAFAGGEVIGPRVDLPEGAAINLRVRSRDVAIALDRPGRTSILNVLPGRVVEIGPNDGPQAHVLLDVGTALWARIMRRSVNELELRPGRPVYALIKAVAVDRRSLGRPTAMDLSLEERDAAPPDGRR
ncbi:MAG: molybdenum ABC transporter ATP-binding protein [Immundisolibacterales bacterium]|nr:molybdenum ABC transporter ATP-binding protein [Immundisolibacterales bacterium]